MGFRIVTMGVAGCGKSSLGAALAVGLGVTLAACTEISGGAVQPVCGARQAKPAP